MVFIPAMEAPRQKPMDAISSSPCMQIPPAGGRSFNMVLKMVVAGVMGYPAKKLHPAITAALAIASFPSIKDVVTETSLKKVVFLGSACDNGKKTVKPFERIVRMDIQNSMVKR
jgi:hypothetical protein